LISIGIMGIVFSILNIKFSRFVIFLPMIILVETVLIIGASLFVSSIQVRFRDIRYIVEIFLLIIFYLSPIFYPIDLVKSMPNVFFKLYMLNPFVSIVTLYRVIFLRDYLSVLSQDSPYLLLYIVIYPVLCSVIVFFIGFFVFKKLELNFVDHL
jgi:ABC-2 type transport system permease protein